MCNQFVNSGKYNRSADFYMLVITDALKKINVKFRKTIYKWSEMVYNITEYVLLFMISKG